MVLDAINPALHMPPLLATIVASVIVTLFITFVYKWMTDQKEMKALKDEIKQHNAEMKKNKSDSAKVMELQKKAMQINMKYFTKSMKPTLLTFIPLILIFAWLNSSLSYHPIMPGQEFTTTILLNEGIIGNAEIAVVGDGLQIIDGPVKNITSEKVKWKLKGNEGEYLIDYKVNGNSCSECRKSVIITNEQRYAPVLHNVKNSAIKKIEMGNKKLIIFWKLSWIWVYIIISIALSMGLRKLLKIY